MQALLKPDQHTFAASSLPRYTARYMRPDGLCANGTPSSRPRNGDPLGFRAPSDMTASGALALPRCANQKRDSASGAAALVTTCPGMPTGSACGYRTASVAGLQVMMHEGWEAMRGLPHALTYGGEVRMPIKGCARALAGLLPLPTPSKCPHAGALHPRLPPGTWHAA